MKIKCIIVDDEPLARAGLQEYISELDYLHHVQSFESALAADSYLSKNPVDLMLLDIRMPKLSGIDFLRNLKNPPLVIFTTAFPDYALESYELNVIDYLVKPISFERFAKATQKAFDYFTVKNQQNAPDYFFIKCNHKLERVMLTDVLYVEAMQNYCIIHTAAQKLICYITLTAMQEKLSTDRFMKVHKSFIVAVDKVTGMQGNTIEIANATIPVSRTLRQQVQERITGNNLLKR